MKEVRIVPLGQISNYFDLQITTPPPYRGQLGFREDVLKSVLKTLKLETTPIRVNYFRNEPEIHVAPGNPGNVSAITATAEAESEKKQIPPLVTTNRISDTVTMMLPYTDKDTSTPKKTALHASHMLQKGFSKTPGILYLHDLVVHEDGDAWKEITLSTADTILSTTFAFGGSSLFSITDRIVHSDLSNPSFLQYLMVLYPVMYMAISLHNLYEAYKYTQGSTFEKKTLREIAEYISENPRRAFYPVKLVEEVMVPGILYSMQQFTAKDLIVTTSSNNR
jgi:hypothetical protein